MVSEYSFRRVPKPPQNRTTFTLPSDRNASRRVHSVPPPPSRSCGPYRTAFPYVQTSARATWTSAGDRGVARFETPLSSAIRLDDATTARHLTRLVDAADGRGHPRADGRFAAART